jgi:23S rRNA (adenine2503-C2)-methyltransferase
MDTRVNLLDFNRPLLSDFFASLGEKPYRAAQVQKWIHRHGVVDFAAMTDISKPLRERLADVAEIRLPRFTEEHTAADLVTKWLVRLADGNAVETVYIPDEGRATLCVSSQVGCPLACAFCATGKAGFRRDLTAGEIIGQVLGASLRIPFLPGAPPAISNVVLMGMGEPLLNFDNVCTAMDIMMDDLAYGLGRRRVTLSTAGYVPAMDRLRGRCPVSLAVSLHAPDDELRDHLVPLNRKYPIAELLAACRRYVADDPRATITFEYIMLREVNDTRAHAKRLARLLEGIPCKLNLIPCNPVAGIPFEASLDTALDQFRAVLRAAGYITITRKTRGQEIGGACGQLVGQLAARVPRHRCAGPLGGPIAERTGATL